MMKKKQPTPPAKKYTAKDSSQYHQTLGRFEKTKDSYGNALRTGAPMGNIPLTMRSQYDSLQNNPYAPTFTERQNAKAKTKASAGGEKSTRVASKTKAVKPVAKATAKPMPKKKGK